MSKFAPYPEYASTSVGWLNEIPSHWRVKPLWSLFRRIKRSGHESERLLSVYRDYGVIPKDSRDDNHNRASEDLSAYQLVEPGDLAINKMKAWQGSVGISGHRGIVSPAYFIFKAEHKENPRYIHHLMRCKRYISGYQSISKGIRVNQWDLDPDKHARMPVVLPPSDEQQAIVDFLDHETARIDTLITKKTRFIELLKEKRQAVITKAVTKGLDDSVQMRDSGEEWIGAIPKHWLSVKFNFVARVTEGLVDPKDPPYRDMVLVAPNHIESGTGRLLAQETAAEQNAESGKYTCKQGAVIYSKIRPALAKVVIAPCDCLCSADMYPMSCSEKANPEWLFYLMLSAPFTAWAVLESDRVAMPKINRESLSGLRAFVPPLEEQRSIVDYVNARLARIDRLILKTERSIDLLKEHRAALITAAVTGKIDVREAA